MITPFDNNTLQCPLLDNEGFSPDPLSPDPMLVFAIGGIAAFNVYAMPYLLSGRVHLPARQSIMDGMAKISMGILEATGVNGLITFVQDIY